jgi:scyllo-inositol 2-dehydrogenase (NADP+)
MTAVPRIAVVGSGLSARLFHRATIDATPDVQFAGFVSRTGQVSADSGVIANSIGDLAKSDVDVVVIATPDATHSALAEESLALGFATIVDKPLTASFEDAVRLTEFARTKGVPLTAFHNRRWDGDFLTLAELVSAGTLGEPTRFETSITRWSPMVGPTWRDQPAPGGIDGALGSLGSHLVDQCLALFGAVDSVYAEIRTRRAGAATNDDVFAALHHSSGVISHVVASSMVAADRPRLRLDGVRGAFVSNGFDGQQDQLVNGILPSDPQWGVPTPAQEARIWVEGTEQKMPLQRGDWREFYRRLGAWHAGRGALPVDMMDVLQGLQILDAALESSRSGTVVTIEADRIGGH